MSGLPNGWTQTALGAISNVVRGITFPASAKENSPTTHNVCCLRTSNIQREVEWGDIYFVARSFVKREEQFVQTGDVLMSMANSYELVGKVAIAKEVKYPTAFGAFLSAIRPTVAADGKYLFHLLRTAQVQSEVRQGSSQTTNIANISVGTLSNIGIPLAPLPEQKRIADKLDSMLARVDACRDHLDRLPALLKRFRQSILAAATSGQLTEDWRANHGIAIFTWKETTLSGACRKITDGEHITPQVFDDGVPLVSAKDVREWGVDLSDTKFVSAQFAETSRKRCGPEFKDVLVVSRGATVGRTCLVTSNKVFCLMGSVLLFKPNAATAISEYFAYFLSSPSGLEQLTKASGATAQQAIYIRDAKNLPIQLPTLPEQTEIVRRVEILFAFADRLEARLATARRQVGQLTPALLAKAFRGELVAQDPADEPAAELLKRLAAQRESAPKVKRGRARA